LNKLILVKHVVKSDFFDLATPLVADEAAISALLVLWLLHLRLIQMIPLILIFIRKRFNESSTHRRH